MKSVHVIAGLDPADGGPAYSVPRLCQALLDQGCGAQILTVRGPGTPAVQGLTAFAALGWGLPVLDQLRVSPALAQATRAAAAEGQVIHSHGFWLMPNVHAGRAAARHGAPLVVSPRGMLAPAALAFSARRKRLFWALLQRAAYARASLFHATSEAEAADIRAFGITAPVAVIPNGIDAGTARARHDSATGQRTLLFLSRLHPKKGLPVLLAAWRALQADWPDWQLVIAGADEGGHRAELEALVNTYGLSRVLFTGPVYGAAKDAWLEKADLFVLPTLNENFGIAVAEALAAEIPVVVTRGAPWAGVETHGCGWWIDQGEAPLVAALGAGMALAPQQRQAMGQRGRAWMAEAFGWDRIGAQMAEAYRWISGTGPRPATLFAG